MASGIVRASCSLTIRRREGAEVSKKQISTAAGQAVTDTRQHRIDHGLCPECGEEAAPYYLCEQHRRKASLGRILRSAATRGVLRISKRGGRNWYSVDTGCRPASDVNWPGKTIFDMNENDKRLRPRLGRRPVDIDETLIGIFVDSGRPLQYDEIISAWGRLRSKRKTASLAGDMTAIIEAQRRRAARNAKRARDSNDNPPTR